MQYLLDTHVLVYRLQDADELPKRYHRLLDEAEAAGERLGVSDISLWEIAMLAMRGRLAFSKPFDEWLLAAESHPSIDVLPITARVAAESVRLGPSFPRDPADRLIAATTRCHGLRLMTLDGPIRDSGAVAIA